MENWTNPTPWNEDRGGGDALFCEKLHASGKVDL
jgi:hypothetical protein